MDLEQVNPWSRNRFIRGFRRGSGASVLVFRIPSLPKLRYRAHPKWGEFPKIKIVLLSTRGIKIAEELRIYF